MAYDMAFDYLKVQWNKSGFATPGVTARAELMATIQDAHGCGQDNRYMYLHQKIPDFWN